MERISRYIGALIGLACGDAIGTSVEFKPRGSFDPVTDLTGGGPFNLQPGQWTDDTSMALCLADSLIRSNGFNAQDQMNNYLAWMNDGKYSSNGYCFDIGNGTRNALVAYGYSGDPFSGSKSPDQAGNGCLMRLAPVPMLYSRNHKLAIEMSGESARTTHGSGECIDASRLFGWMLVKALSGGTKDQILLPNILTSPSARLKFIASGGYIDLPEHKISSSGYVVNSLEAALWCFARTDNFRDAILMAANLGDDADTVAAICGQIAGAFYGYDGIPVEWREKLVMHDEIIGMASRLYEMSDQF